MFSLGLLFRQVFSYLNKENLFTVKPVINKQNLLPMRIKTKNQYNTVLKQIDVLLDLTFLNPGQTQKLKYLLDALDEYQTNLFEDQNDATSELVKDYSLKSLYKLN